MSVRGPDRSRADLIRALGGIAGLSAGDEEAIAAAFGFVGNSEVNKKSEEAALVEAPVRVERVTGPAPVPVPVSAPPTALPSREAVRFWQATEVESRSEREEEASAALPEMYRKVLPLTPEDTARTGRALPGKPSLTAWARLWPFLHTILGRERALRAPALRRLLPRLGRAEAIHRIPRKSRRKWSSTLVLIVDDEERLGLWQEDFRELCRRLLRVRGRGGLRVISAGECLAAPEKLTRGLEPGGSVLALSDLGCLEPGDYRIERWLGLGRRLRSRGVEPWVLAPCPEPCLDVALLQFWQIAEWDGRRLRAARAPADGESPRGQWLKRSQAEGERLLRWLAVTVRVELGLLRAVRRALDGERLGVAHEYWAWHHPAWTGAEDTARSLGEAEARSWREGLAERDLGALAVVVRAVGIYRDYCSPAIGQIELQLVRTVLARHGRDDAETRRHFAPDAEWERAREFQHRIVRGLWDGERRWEADLAVWGDTQCRLLANGLADPEWQATWALKERCVNPGVLELPATVQMRQVAWVFKRREAERAYELLWDIQGGGLVVRQVDTPAPVRVAGLAPLAFFKSHRTEVGLEISDGKRLLGRLLLPLPDGDASQVVPIDPAARVLRLDAGRELVVLKNEFRCAAFASMGQDQYGLYGDLELAEGVALRLRWVPPGRFWMGSPEDEAGRYPNEGPQHEVTISSGFWLASTPITRGQWRAVMGGKAVTREDLAKPVVAVDWAQARVIGMELAERYPELVFDLPSEAEWEYACRAGTETAFNDGSACIVPEGEDPALEALKEAKRPNPWGLHQMHGSVWQWCLDGWRDYAEAAVLDPLAAENGAFRVVRGGGWHNRARLCRSAYRYGDLPGYRRGGQGFRLAAGQELHESDVARGLAAEAPRGDPTTSQIRRGVRRARPWAQRFARDAFGVRLEFTLRDTPFVWRWIPRGVFTMGSPLDEVGRWETEGPQHEVTISRGFWLGATSVTQAQWVAVLGSAFNVSRFKGAERPVEHVNWQACVDYAGELNRLMPGLGARLPREAEWEYACRAGTQSAFNDGSACTDPEGRDPALDTLGWYEENSGRQTQPVGQKRPNAWGLHDMHGNVWEWCADGLRKYGVESEPNPLGPLDGHQRVVRGGGWLSFARPCRSAFRYGYGPGYRNDDLGFRLAAGPELQGGAQNEELRVRRVGEGAEPRGRVPRPPQPGARAADGGPNAAAKSEKKTGWRKFLP